MDGTVLPSLTYTSKILNTNIIIFWLISKPNFIKQTFKDSRTLTSNDYNLSDLALVKNPDTQQNSDYIWDYYKNRYDI